jgi:hypothetical protein
LILSRHRTVSHFLSIEQDELIGFASSFGNALSRHLCSRAKTEALNPHYRCRLPSPDHSTLTLHCYKKSSQLWSLSPPLNQVSILPPP